jgi:hypothetical protein
MRRWKWLSLLVSKTVFACACGCGVFEVTLPSMMPRNTENTVFLNIRLWIKMRLGTVAQKPIAL